MSLLTLTSLVPLAPYVHIVVTTSPSHGDVLNGCFQRQIMQESR